MFHYGNELTLFVCQFINHLINQLARHQFLKIACQLEKRNMLAAFTLLKVVESELQAYLSATEGRVVRFLIFFYCTISVKFLCSLSWTCYMYVIIWPRWNLCGRTDMLQLFVLLSINLSMLYSVSLMCGNPDHFYMIIWFY